MTVQYSGGDNSQSDSTNQEKEKEKENRRVCDECGGSLYQENGELVCEECGLVADENRIDRGPEWRAYDHEEQQQKSRVGAPTTQTQHEKGLTTDIDWRDKDAYGNSLSTTKQNQLRRLRKWHERIRTKNSGERNLQFALSEIDRMASALGVPQSVREIASVIYRQALDNDLIRGRSIEGVATAALYGACRQEQIPRSIDEMETISRVDEREIGRTYRYIADELNLQIEPVDPTQYVPRFCADLDVSQEVEQKAKEIIEKTANTGLLSGKSPIGFAAAGIYTAALICREDLTQNEVAEAAQVTEVTIRNRYQEQIKALGITQTP